MSTNGVSTLARGLLQGISFPIFRHLLLLFLFLGFLPSLSVSLYHGPNRELDPKAEVTITSYALLRQDVERLTEPQWDCVVLDEAQAIKNPESQIARAAHRLDARARFALTGKHAQVE